MIFPLCFFSAEHLRLKSSCQLSLNSLENKILGLGQKKMDSKNIISRSSDSLQGVSPGRSQYCKTWIQITESSLQIIISTEPTVKMSSFKTKPKIQARLKMSPSQKQARVVQTCTHTQPCCMNYVPLFNLLEYTLKWTLKLLLANY